jgi:DNA recombination protein RmuC
MGKRLRDVEALPGEQAAGLLGDAFGDASSPEGDDDL